MSRKQIGCEIGNFSSKLMAFDIKDKPIEIPNVICEGANRRKSTMAMGGTKEMSLINLLDVTIDCPTEPLASGRFFVGGLALKEGKNLFKPTREDRKSMNYQTMVQLLTTTAFYLFDPQKPVKHEDIDISTLLPTEEFYPDENDENDYVEIFKRKLIGEHTVKFNDPAFNGAKITIDIKNPIVSPEGTAGQMASTYDWNGNVVKEMEGLENKIVMNIDIGSIDINVSILENGEFVDKGFFGLKAGTTDVLRDISNDIKAEYGHEFDIHKLDYHIRTLKPLYVGNDDITEFLKKKKESRYGRSAVAISKEISEMILDRGIKKNEISITNITGGGCQFFKDGLENHFKTQRMKITVPESPRFRNVEGALKVLMFAMQNSDPIGDEVYSE